MYVISVSEFSGVNFIVGWKLFASFVKLFIASWLIYVPSRKDVVNVSFPNKWFVRASVDDISLNFHHKDVSKVLPFCSH